MLTQKKKILIILEDTYLIQTHVDFEYHKTLE